MRHRHADRTMGAGAMSCFACGVVHELERDPATSLEVALFRVRRTAPQEAWMLTTDYTCDGIYHWAMRRGPVRCFRCQDPIASAFTGGYQCRRCGLEGPKATVPAPSPLHPVVDPGLVAVLREVSRDASAAATCNHCGAALPFDGSSKW